MRARILVEEPYIIPGVIRPIRKAIMITSVHFLTFLQSAWRGSHSRNFVKIDIGEFY